MPRSSATIGRRRFLHTLTSAASATTATAAAPLSTLCAQDSSESSAPLVYYSNDTTHILSCLSPYRQIEDRASGFTDDHLRASITETAAADVHLLQPGLGWVPWWDSGIYSPSDHYVDFLGEHGITGLPPIARYLLAGGDIVRTLVEHCRSLGVKPYVSFRLNDGHHVRKLADALEKGRPSHEMSRHFWENYEPWRIGPDPTDWAQGVFDWRIPEVRDYKFSLIHELCANYDIDGLELDFVRHWSRFNADATAAEERREITTDFVRRVREALDATTRDGRRRQLCVRVPANQEVHDEQGIDLASLVRAGVDVITLSYSYFTMQDDSVVRARAACPDTTVLVEMTHTTLTGKATAGSGTQPYLRTTEPQFHSTAHLAYLQGANGVSLFNFPYYREHKMAELGPFHEPPFHVLEQLKDRDFLARQPQWYFLSAGRKDPVLGERPLRAILQRDEPRGFTMEMAPTQSHRKNGVLRLRSDEAIDDREIEVIFNGEPLKRIGHVSHPLPHPYKVWLGTAEQMPCFEFPATLARTGTNQVTVTVKQGARVRLFYLDATLPT